MANNKHEIFNGDISKETANLLKTIKDEAEEAKKEKRYKHTISVITDYGDGNAEFQIVGISPSPDAITGDTFAGCFALLEGQTCLTYQNNLVYDIYGDEIVMISVTFPTGASDVMNLSYYTTTDGTIVSSEAVDPDDESNTHKWHFKEDTVSDL